MKLKPVGAGILIEMISEGHPTFSIPDTGYKLRRGKVIGVGPGWIDDNGNQHPCNCVEGDTIAYMGDEIPTFEASGKKMRLIQNDLILGIIDESP